MAASECARITVPCTVEGSDSDSWLDYTELSNCKALLSDFCIQHDIQLPLSKQQTRKRAVATRQSLPRASKRARILQ
jgi:hypothetical protein